MYKIVEEKNDIDEEIKKLIERKEELCNREGQIENRKMELMEYRVKDLRIIAQQKFILSYWGMKKEILISKILEREHNDILNGINDDCFSMIRTFMGITDEINLRNTCKTMRMRIKKKEVETLETQCIKIKRGRNTGNILKMTMGINGMFKKEPKYEDNKGFIVDFVKVMLQKCDNCTMKADKKNLAMAIMLFVVGREKFMKKHVKFCKTVWNKLHEFKREEAMETDKLFKRVMLKQEKRMQEYLEELNISPCPGCSRFHNI